MLTYLWAYLAGVLTLVNPCVLPILPITVASALQHSSRGPLALAAGLVVSFSVLGVGVSAFGHLVGIDSYVINQAAALMMIVFGLVLLIPASQVLLVMASAPLAGTANAGLSRVQSAGLLSQFLVGGLLGAAWSPCIGPTLGAAVSLAASGENLGEASLTMMVFGLGVSTVLLGLAYGSRRVLDSRRARLTAIMPWAKPLMGTTLLMVGVGIFFHFEDAAEAWLLDMMPIWLQDLAVSV